MELMTPCFNLNKSNTDIAIQTIPDVNNIDVNIFGSVTTDTMNRNAYEQCKPDTTIVYYEYGINNDCKETE